MKKICVIIGTRPEIIKMSPVIRELQKNKIDFFILHTNQHYSQNMDAIFLDELDLPSAKYNLGIGSGFHGEMTGKMLFEIEKVLLIEKPDWVLVQGDTNTVLAGALAASKLQIKVGHVEAGLRSYDRTMPEELNRIVADHASDGLFAPTKKQYKVLIKENIDKKKILITGNTIVDAVIQNLKLLKKHPEFNHYEVEKFFLLTLHRPSNVDNKENLLEIIEAITKISKTHNIITYFPIHPRTKKQLEIFGIQINSNYIKIIDPVGYLEMLALETNAQLILTDSGGIQEEACILQIPCLTLRENTERPETLEVGASKLVGHDYDKIIGFTDEMLLLKRQWKNPFGDGKASRKIVKFIAND